MYISMYRKKNNVSFGFLTISAQGEQLQVYIETV